MKDEIIASFVWTERDFFAAARALLLVNDSVQNSPILRAGNMLGCFIALLAGPIVVFAAIRGGEGRREPIPPLTVGIGLLASLGGAYALFVRRYMIRMKLCRYFEKSQIKDTKVSYVFRSDGFESTSAESRSQSKWSVVDRFVEFRDGFLIIIGPGGAWLPKSALGEAFEETELSIMAKARVRDYQFVDKLAAEPLRGDGGRRRRRSHP